MKKSSELLDLMAKHHRIKVTKTKGENFDPDHVGLTMHISQKSLSDGYTVSFYDKKDAEKPKIQVKFLNLYERISEPSCYGNMTYQTVSEKTVFSAQVFDEKDKQIGAKKKTFLKKRSFKESLDNFLVVENGAISIMINMAKKMVKKQIEKEEKQEQKRKNREDYKEAVVRFLDDVAQNGF